MEEIVVAHRTFGRLLALLPAMAVALAVRALTMTSPALPLRAAAAAAVALAAWVVYRLLTTAVVVHGEGVRVRGVWYEATIPWRELHDVSVEPSGWAVRALVWGVMQPRTLRLRTSTRTLRPLAAVSHDGDDELDRALGAMRVRLGAWGVPAQRQPEAGVDSRA